MTTIWSRSVFHSSVHTYFRAGGKRVLEINRKLIQGLRVGDLNGDVFSFKIVSFIQGPASLPACLPEILQQTRGGCLFSLAFPRTNFQTSSHLPCWLEQRVLIKSLHTPAVSSGDRAMAGEVSEPMTAYS